MLKLVLLAISIGVSGDVIEDLATCREIEDSLQRLRCYDNLTVADGVEGEDSGSPEIESEAADGEQDADRLGMAGEWIISSEVNPLDDSTTTVAMLQATEGKNKYGKPIALFIRCSKRKIDIFINWDEYLDSNGWTSVATRFDGSPPKATSWGLSTDGTATFLSWGTAGLNKRRKTTLSFVQNLRNSEKFVAQTTPYREGRRTVVFELEGVEEALQQLSACKYWLEKE